MTVKLGLLRKMDVRFYAVFLSIVLSWVAIGRNEPINYDGILYLSSAAAYLKTGFSAAFALYPWPFYAILIAWLSKATHLSLLCTAHLLNSIFLLVIVTTFITILKELGASRSVQIFGALVILVYPQLNNYRDLVVRDFGYWAFFLLAFWQLLRYAQTSRWVYALGWSGTILIATLFRIEGVVLFIFTPFLLLLLQHKSWRVRSQLFLRIYLFVALSALLLVGFLAYTHHQASLGRFSDALYQLKHGWFLVATKFTSSSMVVGHTILSPYSDDYGYLFVAIGLFGLFVAQLVSALNPLFTLLCAHVLIKKLLTFENNKKILLYGFISLNLLIPLSFFAQDFFLSSRYLFAACLLLLLLAPFSLQRILTDWQQRKAWYAPVVMLVLIIMAFGSINHFAYSKVYIVDAGHWLQQNTPQSATVYSNNKQVLFYAQRTPIDFQAKLSTRYDDSQPLQTVQSKAWRGYDYLALRIAHQAHADEAKIIAIVGVAPVMIFHNRRDDTVLIFKLH